MNIDEVKFIVACALGATVRVLRNDSVTIRRKLTEVICGFAVAYYFGSGAIVQWGIDPALAASLGFIIGLVGMELCGLLLTIVTAYGPAVFRALARKWLGIEIAPASPNSDEGPKS